MATTEQEVLHQEQRLAEAKRALDLEAVDDIYADDLVMSGVMGEPRCSKSAILDEVRHGRHGPPVCRGSRARLSRRQRSARA